MTSARRPTLIQNPIRNHEERGLALAVAAGLLCVLIMAVLLILAARL